MQLQLFIYRELFEIIATPKGQQRQGAPEPSEMIQLLTEKDKDIKDCLKTGNN